MTNTEKLRPFDHLAIRIDSGVISTGGRDEPKKVSLRIEVPGFGVVGTTLTGDQVLALLTGSTFETAAAWLPEDPADEARLVGTQWVTRDEEGYVAGWTNEEKARAYACGRQARGKTDRVFHREVWEREV